MTKNWIKKTENGNYISTKYEPVFGTTSTTADYFLDGTWYDSTGTAYTTPITYLPIVALIDEQSNIVDTDSYDIPTLNEKYIKADIVRGEFKGVNACTAYVNFDGTSTPPTIRDSYNVSQVVRTATGEYDVYFEEPMDNTNYSVNVNPIMDNSSGTGGMQRQGNSGNYTVNKVHIYVGWVDPSSQSVENNKMAIQIFGGKND